MSRYPIKASPYSSHSHLLSRVGDGLGRRLLDVGCSDGTLSVGFLSLGWKVVGIEPFAEDAQSARAKGIDIHEMTLEEALEQIDTKFNVIILADVLEHCADPWSQLQRLLALCLPDATIFISLPNVAHIVTRFQLLFGRFEYVDRGILDRTHLRFFTRETALDLVTHAGLQCDSITPIPTPVELVYPTLMTNAIGREALRINAILARIFPRIFGYQFFMSCSIRK